MAARLHPLLVLPFVLALFASAGASRAQQSAPAPDGCPSEHGCTVASGHYRILLPPEPEPGWRYGAIMFFHGYQETAEGIVSDPGLAAVARRLGVALIAPDGLERSWSFPGSPARNRDEFAFVAEVLDDVARRFPVDPARIMASGFSQGGSMVWYLACRMPTRFAAFAPVAGAFWEPLPESCAGPRPPLIHVHGTNDGTVPLAGRTLRNGIRQGDVFRSFAILAPKACTSSWADAARAETPAGELTCHVASGCGGPARLELCLHSGGHMVDPAWVERAWQFAMPAIASSSATGAALTSP